MDPHLSRQLGQLQGSVEALQQQLAKSEAKAAESRDRVFRALEDIRSDAQLTRNRTEALERIMSDEVRPVVRSVTDWRSRALGGLFVLGVIGTVVLAILGLAKEAVMSFINMLLGR